MANRDLHLSDWMWHYGKDLLETRRADGIHRAFLVSDVLNEGLRRGFERLSITDVDVIRARV